MIDTNVQMGIILDPKWWHGDFSVPTRPLEFIFREQTVTIRNIRVNISRSVSVQTPILSTKEETVLIENIDVGTDVSISLEEEE